jgi:hypothetical protein
MATSIRGTRQRVDSGDRQTVRVGTADRPRGYGGPSATYGGPSEKRS